MGLFKRKPTEDEVERGVLFAAMIAKAQERDTQQLATDSEIQQFLVHVFKDINVKPDQQQKKLALMSVQALLAEGNFINEALDFRLKNGGAPMPVHFREKMLAAIQSSVNQFMAGPGRL